MSRGVLRDPSAVEFGRNLEQIAKGGGHRRPDRDRVAGRSMGEGGHPRGGMLRVQTATGSRVGQAGREARGSRGADSRSPGGMNVGLVITRRHCGQYVD